MLEKKERRLFSRRLSKVLDDCKLSKDEISGNPYFDDTGYWEETKHIHYYFHGEKIISHKEAYREEILSICRDLPKIEKEAPGFGGIISPIALLSNPPTRTLFMHQAMEIDEFCHLIHHLDIGLIVPVEFDGNKSFLIAIFEEYRNQIQSKPGQENIDS